MELANPATELYGSFLWAYEEIGVDSPDGGGFVGREAVETEGIVDFLHGAETRGSYPGWVTASNYWIVDGGEVAGMISLRHELNEALENFYGHVGYTVRPSLRRRGIARRALGEVCGAPPTGCSWPAWRTTSPHVESSRPMAGSWRTPASTRRAGRCGATGLPPASGRAARRASAPGARCRASRA